jgi:DNA-binding transcriptional ArsR family regulator
VSYQLEAIHDALRSEIRSEIRSEMSSEMSSEKGSELAAAIGATPGAAIDALILRDLATEPTFSARRLAERLQLSQRAVEKHLASLQQKERLRRHGSPRAGHWQVL